MEPTQIAIFKKKEIRKTLHNGEWWFSVIDIIGAVTESDRPRKYWSDLKKKLAQEGYSQLSEKIGQLKLQSSDGKYYETDCGDTETMFRIIQSIPSPKPLGSHGLRIKMLWMPPCPRAGKPDR